MEFCTKGNGIPLQGSDMDHSKSCAVCFDVIVKKRKGRITTRQGIHATSTKQEYATMLHVIDLQYFFYLGNLSDSKVHYL
jgi:hypothetical protein